jgi:energy-coupling factor transporter ATP-binding protein EcfA2
LRRAKDNPFAAQRLAGLAFRGETVEELAARCERLGRRVAIVGPHGSGKSTLLRQVQARLASGYEIRAVTLHAGERWLSRPQRRLLFSRLGPQRLVVVDGAEQLSALAWRELSWRSRRAAGLVVTAHREGLLPTLTTCATTPELLAGLVRELTGEELPEPLCAELFARHRGNLHDVFWELYDRWAGGF